MTRLKSIVLGGAAAALIMAGAVTKSSAMEPGTFNYLPGNSIGIPAGAAAPPGIYTGLEMLYPTLGQNYGNQGGVAPGGTAGNKLGATIGIIPIVWSTGWNFLGASYSVAVVQPLVTAFIGPNGNNNACSSLAGQTCIWQEIVIPTVWQPLNLSWNLGGGFFASIAFSFQAPTGSSYAGTAAPDYWIYEPGAAISYLSANWLLSANMAYIIYGPSKGTGAILGGVPALAAFANGYTNGQEFDVDLTALYKLGKWSFGPVGYVAAQTTADKAGGPGCAALAAAVPTLACGNLFAAAIGGLVGYDFGPVDMQVWVTDQFSSRDTPGGGVGFWSRIGFRLWGPEAPRPLVAKN